MTPSRRPSRFRIGAVLLGALGAGVWAAALGGCIKVQMLVRLNEDGTGTVTEDITFCEKLVNVTQRARELPSIEELTGDECVRSRLANMGQGVRLVSKKVAERPDGGVRLTVVYAFEDISELRTPAVPWGFGWEKYYLKWTLSTGTTLQNRCVLHASLANLRAREMQAVSPNTEPLGELEAQQIRALLPVFKDLLDGFELSLRVEIFEKKQWASASRAHGRGGYNGAAGRLLLYRLTDLDLRNSDDGLLMVLPWRQPGREVELWRMMPHVNAMFHDLRWGGFQMTWRVIQGPHGREYW